MSYWKYLGSTAVTGLQYGGEQSSYPRPSNIRAYEQWRLGNDAEAHDSDRWEHKGSFTLQTKPNRTLTLTHNCT